MMTPPLLFEKKWLIFLKIVFIFNPFDVLWLPFRQIDPNGVHI